MGNSEEIYWSLSLQKNVFCQIPFPDKFVGFVAGTSLNANMSIYRAVSLFCGCGGFDLGFKKEGFDLIYACDNDPAAVSCYSRNIDARVHERDVTGADFHRELVSLGNCDVVIGGFPCQGFSKAGPKQQGDPRNTLYLEMRRAVETLRPKVFVAENVDGISQNFGGSFVQRIVEDFAALGYNVEHRILQAADFGVPQFRRRIFFVGVRNDRPQTFSWPKPTNASDPRNGEFTIKEENFGPLFSNAGSLEPELPRSRTIADAIADLCELNPEIPDHAVYDKWPENYIYIFRAIQQGQKLCNVRHAETSVYTWEIPEAFGTVSSRERIVLETISKNRRHRKYGDIPNGNPLAAQVIEDLSGVKSIENEIRSLLDKKYLKEIDGKYDLLGAMFCSGLFKRPKWDEPSPTVLTVFDNPRYFLHPLRDRPFSARECARLQGFPDAFNFCYRGNGAKPVTLKDAYRLIGNAVPPPVAAVLAKSVKVILDAGTGTPRAHEAA